MNDDSNDTLESFRRAEAARDAGDKAASAARSLGLGPGHVDEIRRHIRSAIESGVDPATATQSAGDAIAERAARIANETPEQRTARVQASEGATPSPTGHSPPRDVPSLWGAAFAARKARIDRENGGGGGGGAAA